MMDPRHDCWNVRKRTTFVRLTDTWFASAGASLRVLLSAFLDEDLTWYSVEDYPDRYEVVALGFAGDRLPSERVEQDDGPLHKAVGDLADMREYVLSEGVRRELDFPAEMMPKRVPPGARCLICVHDDCFVSVLRPSGEAVRKLVRAVLNLHSFYLGSEVDWASVLEDVLALLESHKEVRFRSNRRRQILALSWKRERGWLRSLRRECRHIAVSCCGARFIPI